ncbi:MAG: PEP-CTERM sorting domain-containing protein [Candidatus Solibacter sp.]|nr:PEP-CTERM sorting domain-containing protein [Candidatus Solibacter sp.]
MELKCIGGHLTPLRTLALLVTAVCTSAWPLQADSLAWTFDQTVFDLPAGGSAVVSGTITHVGTHLIERFGDAGGGTIPCGPVFLCAAHWDPAIVAFAAAHHGDPPYVDLLYAGPIFDFFLLPDAPVGASDTFTIDIGAWDTVALAWIETGFATITARVIEAPVPEPGAWLLLCSAMGGCVLIRRRCR